MVMEWATFFISPPPEHLYRIIGGNHCQGQDQFTCRFYGFILKKIV